MITKAKYEEIIKLMPSILLDNDLLISGLANFIALIHQELNDVSWTGLYIYHNDELHLGPFQGQVACTKIPYGMGVCGTCIKLKKTIIVPNVHKFIGHIACDARSNSEIVLPIIIDNEIWGVLDLDSLLLNRFKEDDKYHLEILVDLLKGFIKEKNLK